jgi:hypothetical protein
MKYDPDALFDDWVAQNLWEVRVISAARRDGTVEIGAVCLGQPQPEWHLGVGKNKWEALQAALGDMLNASDEIASTSEARVQGFMSDHLASA